MASVFSTFTWVINLLVQNVDKILIVINGKLSDVIYHPRDCNTSLKLFLFATEPYAYNECVF